MIEKLLLRPGRTVLVAVVMAAMASMAFARPSAEKSGGAAAQAQTQTQVAVAGPGVLVAAVLSGSPAEKAGIVRGDIILSADGKDISTGAELQSAVLAHKTGDTLSLKIKHGDTEKTVSVTLASFNNRTYLGVEPLAAGYGMRAAPFNRGPNGPVFQAGAVVASVASGAPAEKAGIKAGDVILSVDGTAVGPESDLAALISQHKPGDKVTLSVESSGQQPKDVQVTLGANPQKADAAYLGIQYSLYAGNLGMAPFMQGPFGNRMYNRQFRGGAPRQGVPGRNGQVVQGVMVIAVADNSPAAQAGIKARDIITAIDGVAVLAPRQIVDTVSSHKAGDKLTVTVYRFNDNVSTDLTVTLAAPPAGSSQTTGAYMGITMNRFMGSMAPEANEPRTDFDNPAPQAPGAPQAPAAPQPLERPAPGGA